MIFPLDKREFSCIIQPMKKDDHRKLFDLLTGLGREIRCCGREEAFCAGVTFQQFVILDLVSLKEEVNLSDLHSYLSVDKSTTTRLMGPLLREGFLKRETAPHDSRAARLALTEKGREIHELVWSCLSEFFDGILENIPSPRRSEVLSSVQVFTAAIRSVLDGKGCCSSKTGKVRNGK